MDASKSSGLNVINKAKDLMKHVINRASGLQMVLAFFQVEYPGTLNRRIQRFFQRNSRCESIYLFLSVTQQQPGRWKSVKPICFTKITLLKFTLQSWKVESKGIRISSSPKSSHSYGYFLGLSVSQLPMHSTGWKHFQIYGGKTDIAVLKPILSLAQFKGIGRVVTQKHSTVLRHQFFPLDVLHVDHETVGIAASL